MNKEELEIYNKLNIDEIRYFMWNSIDGILNQCGNSYANTWCEQLLSIAKKYGAYNGDVVGDIMQLKIDFNNDYELSKKFMDYDVNVKKRDKKSRIKALKFTS